MAKTITREAPFDSAGNLQHFPEQDWRLPQGQRGPHFRVVEPWRATMRVDEGVTSGRSAKYVHVVDGKGHHFPLFITDLVELLRARTIEKGLVRTCANDRWYVRKRGQNYGVAVLFCTESDCPW